MRPLKKDSFQEIQLDMLKQRKFHFSFLEMYGDENEIELERYSIERDERIYNDVFGSPTDHVTKDRY